MGNCETDRLALVSTLEDVLTLYCKSREIVELEEGNGWGEIIQLLLVLKLDKAHLYNAFFAFTTKYIPR